MAGLQHWLAAECLSPGLSLESRLSAMV